MEDESIMPRIINTREHVINAYNSILKILEIWPVF